MTPELTEPVCQITSLVLRKEVGRQKESEKAGGKSSSGLL
jgi:hypothetical protein